MKIDRIFTTRFLATLSAAVFAVATPCLAQQTNTPTAESAAQIEPYPVPEEKQKMWDEIKAVAEKDLAVCREHCGYEESCFNKCRSAYKSRLGREYKVLMEKEQPASQP